MQITLSEQPNFQGPTYTTSYRSSPPRSGLKAYTSHSMSTPLAIAYVVTFWIIAYKLRRSMVQVHMPKTSRYLSHTFCAHPSTMWFSAIATSCFLSAVLAKNTQVLLQADHKWAKVITPGLSKDIEKVIDTYQVPGISAAFVRKDGTVEMGAWGKRSEDGDLTTPDVSTAI